MQVRDKVWVVTGAGSGMGRELCLALLAQGAKVAAVDVNAASLEETRSLAAGAPLSVHVVDITDQERVAQLPEEVQSAHGNVDGLINNAGIIQPFVRVADLPLSKVERVMNINFYGTLYMTQAFLPLFKQRPAAHVVNVSSMGGFLPVPGQTIYGASKAAVKLFSEGLSAELLDTNIRVSVVFPGAIATNITENSQVKTPGGSPEAAEKSSFQPLPAAQAAQIILKGVEGDRYHIYVGSDAKMMSRLTRLMPERAAKMIASKMKSLLAD